MRMYQLKKLVIVGTLFLILMAGWKLSKDFSSEEWIDSAIFPEQKLNDISRRTEVSTGLAEPLPEDDGKKEPEEKQNDEERLSLKQEMTILEKEDVPFDETMKAIDNLRQERLRTKCSRSHDKKSILDSTELLKLETPVSMLVSDDYKVMFCFTGDVYSKNWEMTLGKGNLRSLYSYRAESITYRLKYYYKFLVVQEPLVRLLSAYKSWLLSGEEQENSDEKKLYQEIQKIAEAIPRKRDDPGINSTKQLTFSDFASYVASNALSNEGLHSMWERLDVLCQPCSLNYDFISRAETEQTDSKYLISHLDSKPENQHETAYTASSDAENLEEVRRLLDRDIVKKIYEAYRLDHEFFGYSNL